MLAIKLLGFFAYSLSAVNSVDWQHHDLSIDRIQCNNKNTLVESLRDGWPSFCDSDVDDGVLLFYPGSDLTDVTVEVVGPSDSFQYQLSKLDDLCSVNFQHSRKTIVFANGWVSDSRRDIKRKLQEITKCCNEYNVIIVDFATSITHLYTSANNDIELASYALLKVLDTLILNGVSYQDIIIVGHSVGALIAATTCQWFATERLKRTDKLPLLIALDPSYACDPTKNCLHENVANQTLVIHGNNGYYGNSKPIGVVDYYPNGDCQMQLSCKSQVCSHIFPVWVFVESVCKPTSFYGVRCENTETWKKGLCNKNVAIPINVNLPLGKRGCYFSTTNPSMPYGQGLAGITPYGINKNDSLRYIGGYKPCSVL